jgi:hypothetical protein
MSEPKVRLAIEIIKEPGGEPGVEAVWSNLPPSYVEVEIFTSKADFDADGNFSIMESDPRTHEVKDWGAKYPFEIWTPYTVVYPRNPTAPGAPDEWMVHFELGTEFKHVIVLNAPTAQRALARVIDSYPEAKVTSIRQLDLESEYQQAQTYLEEEILTVSDEPPAEPLKRTRRRK